MSRQPEKAYKNMDFLTSPDARSIRVLAEIMEPAARFRRENIKDTIVMFGSARTRERSVALKELEEARSQFEAAETDEHRLLLKQAEKRLEMSRYYEDARELSRLITEWSVETRNAGSHFLITSGGGPGIMEAANRGATDVDGGQSIGLNISIPHEQGSNPYISDQLNFEFHYFFTRKFWFLYLAKALIVFPGGFGTLDELFETLTLVQTEKLTKDLPVVLYGSSYWRTIINFDALVEFQVISEKDLNLLKFVDTPREALTYLQSRLNSR